MDNYYMKFKRTLSTRRETPYRAVYRVRSREKYGFQTDSEHARKRFELNSRTENLSQF